MLTTVTPIHHNSSEACLPETLQATNVKPSNNFVLSLEVEINIKEATRGLDPSTTR